MTKLKFKTIISTPLHLDMVGDGEAHGLFIDVFGVGYVTERPVPNKAIITGLYRDTAFDETDYYMTYDLNGETFSMDMVRADA